MRFNKQKYNIIYSAKDILTYIGKEVDGLPLSNSSDKIN